MTTNNTFNSFGELSWEETVSPQNNKKTDYKDLFLKLEGEENEIRIVTKPYQYLVHTYKIEGDKSFGHKVKCTLDENCPLCAAGDKAKRRWYVGVIVRKTNSYKLLDMSTLIQGQIKKYSQSKSWGDPEKYDINIVVDKKAPAAQYYLVQPLTKEPLSAADQKIKDSVDLDDLKRRVTPPTLEQVNKILEKIHERVGIPMKAAAPKAQAKGKPAQVDLDDDTDFPSYDE
jgi:hypothetical protein